MLPKKKGLMHMRENIRAILALAEELRISPEVLPPLERAAEGLPWPDLPVSALSAPETAGGAWEETVKRLPPWETDNGMAQLAAVLAAACRTRGAYRRAGVPDGVFLDTMGCLPRFLEETQALTGRPAFDRGFWTWRQTGGLLFRLGTLEFEYVPEGGRDLPGAAPGTPVLHVHIPSDAVLTREALDNSYREARRFFQAEGAAFCRKGAPAAVLCDSWLLAPALDELLPEGSGIRRFAGDFQRLGVREEDTAFYRWLFRRLEPVPLEELPEDTGLQRAVKARLAAGGTVGAAWGVLRETRP